MLERVLIELPAQFRWQKAKLVAALITWKK